MTKEELRQAAEADLEFFIRLVHPQSVLGSIHCELIRWLHREDAKPHQIVLLPRDHRKSYIAAMDAAWQITRNPAITILYISSTANLAHKQLGLIKDVLTSDIYKSLWPEMINSDEGKRTKWSESEITVDHPKRKLEIVKEPTVFTAGLTTNIVGLHCNRAYLDDVVTAQNSLTEDGRESVSQQYSLLASIATTDSTQLVVGTRYDPDDLYGEMLKKTIQKFDSVGKFVSEEPLYEEFVREVENMGDGSGEYLWPRQQRKDGRWFGFDRDILELKKGLYTDQRMFRAQYYNDPHGGSNTGIPKEWFQYYDRMHIYKRDGYWYFKDKKLNIFASMDFAFTTNEHSDYSSIAVVGVDRDLNYYVLELDRFKTKYVSEYFEHIFKLHQKWGFNKLKAEATGAQSVLIEDLKINYIRKLGVALAIEEFKPYLDKEIRTFNILEPKYANGQIWHYMGGLCQTLEEELMVREPSHDDLRDALAASIEIATTRAPTFKHRLNRYPEHHPKFGGII